MRIVLLTPDLTGYSGWSRYAVDIGKALQERGHELHAIVARPTDASWCTEYPMLRHATAYLNNGFLRWWHTIKLKMLLRRIRPDVVHVIAEPYAMLTPLQQNWKTFLTIHGSYAVVPLYSGDACRALAEKYYQEIDSIIAVSEFTKGYVNEREPKLFADADLQKRITVIHNAIDLQGIQADTTKKPGKPLSIISVSAVKRKKGYLQSIEAIDLFRTKTGADLRYDIIGPSEHDKPFTEELKKEIAKRHLTHIVRIRGTVDDAELDAAYKNADLFLLPSLHDGDYFEGFGLVFLEANARGVPVIGPNNGGCPEAIKDGVSGYLCNPLKIDSIVDRMEDVLIHHRIKRSACVEWAQAHDIRQTIKTIENLYKAQS